MNVVPPFLLHTPSIRLHPLQTVNQSFVCHFCSVSSSPSGPRPISRDWFGIRPPVDATLVGRVYLSPKPASSPARRRGIHRGRRPSRRQRQRGRQAHRHIFDLWGYGDLFDYSDFSSMGDEGPTQQYTSTPVQNVYFFRHGEGQRT